MNRTLWLNTALAALLLGMPMAAKAQGLMSGTGLQPSKQLATPPGAPAIDQPGAEQKALARRSRQRTSGGKAAATRLATGAVQTPPKR